MLQAIYYCIQYFKDTKRKQFTTEDEQTEYDGLLHSIFQRYKTKAIHNQDRAVVLLQLTAFNISKIQNESNSQLLFDNLFCSCYCIQYFKDTKRKQFTTGLGEEVDLAELHSIFQRYKTKAIHNIGVRFS